MGYGFFSRQLSSEQELFMENDFLPNGEARRRANDFIAAIEAFTISISSSNDITIIAGCYLQRGLTKYDNNDIDGARADIAKAIHTDPTGADLFYNRIYFEDDERGITDYTRIIELFPQWPYGYYRRAEYLYEESLIYNIAAVMSDTITALELINEKRDLYGVYISEIEFLIEDIYVDLNKLLKKYGIIDEFLLTDLEKLALDLERLIEIYPNISFYESWLGYLRLEYLKDYQNALENFNRAIVLKPDDSISYFNRGESKYKLRDFTGAREDYNKAVELNPKGDFKYYGEDEDIPLYNEEKETD